MSLLTGKTGEIVGKLDQKADEKRFNDTLKRMLKTPPTPHEKSPKPAREDAPQRAQSAQPGKLSRQVQR